MPRIKHLLPYLSEMTLVALGVNTYLYGAKYPVGPWDEDTDDDGEPDLDDKQVLSCRPSVNRSL